jgi:hypothetical protein
VKLSDLLQPGTRSRVLEFVSAALDPAEIPRLPLDAEEEAAKTKYQASLTCALWARLVLKDHRVLGGDPNPLFAKVCFGNFDMAKFGDDAAEGLGSIEAIKMFLGRMHKERRHCVEHKLSVNDISVDGLLNIMRFNTFFDGDVAPIDDLRCASDKRNTDFAHADDRGFKMEASVARSNVNILIRVLQNTAGGAPLDAGAAKAIAELKSLRDNVDLVVTSEEMLWATQRSIEAKKLLAKISAVFDDTKVERAAAVTDGPDMAAAQRYFDAMHAAGMTATVVTYNTLIKGWCDEIGRAHV